MFRQGESNVAVNNPSQEKKIAIEKQFDEKKIDEKNEKIIITVDKVPQDIVIPPSGLRIDAGKDTSEHDEMMDSLDGEGMSDIRPTNPTNELVRNHNIFKIQIQINSTVYH